MVIMKMGDKGLHVVWKELSSNGRGNICFGVRIKALRLRIATVCK